MEFKGFSLKKFRWPLLFMSMFIWVACSAGPYHFQRSVSVTENFESFHVIPDYNYYYSGNVHKPTAVVGLQQGYDLSSPYWHPVQLDAQKLRVWMDRMMMQPGAEYNVDPNGAKILDDQGKQIGVWYAVWALPKLHFNSQKEIVISNPMTVFPFNNRGDDKGDENLLN